MVTNSTYCNSLANNTCNIAKSNGADINSLTHHLRTIVPIDRFPLRDWDDTEHLLTQALERLSQDHPKEKVQVFARGILKHQ